MIVENKTDIRTAMGVEAVVRMVINPNKVREYCIRRGFYTSGSNEDYDKMLNACRNDDWTPAEVAFDIWNHTNENLKKTMREGGFVIESVLFDIWHECMDVRIEEE